MAVFHQAGEEGPQKLSPELVVSTTGVPGGLVGQVVAVGEGAAVGP